MYEKSSFKYRTVIHGVSDNKIRFYGCTDIFKHHMSALKNGAKMHLVVLKVLRYHGNKARNILILFHFLFKDTLVFSYKKFR